MSIDSDDVRYHVNTYLDESDAERRQLRGELANVRALLAQADEYKADLERQLAAAEKRAEEAEALALRTGNLVRALSRQVEAEISRGEHWLPDYACAECVPNGEILIPGFRCARHAALLLDPAGPGPAAPTQPQEPEPRYHGMTRAEHEAAKVRDDNGRLYCPTCAADDAEARRDAKMVGP